MRQFLPEEYADDRQLRERFQREARAASALNHPNICTIHDIGEEDGRLFIAMEFMDGVTLKDLVQTRPLKMDRLMEIGAQVADGLEAAHAQGILHRDIKPANIFVTRKDHVKILDFGLAKIAGQQSKGMADTDETLVEPDYMTTGGGALGTIAYMSPEQALGKPLDARTDLFSFGVTLYQMATAHVPFQGDTSAVMLLALIQEIPVAPVRLNPDVPEELERIINKCLEKDRDLRYQHASDIRADLKRLQRESVASGARSAAVALQNVRSSGSAVAPSAQPALSSSAPISEAIPQPAKQTGQSATGESLAKVPPKTSRRRAAIFSVAIAFVVALTLVLYLFRHPHKANALANQDAVVLAEFANTSAEPIFDGTLRQALAVDLGQSPFLNIVPDRVVAATLKQMEKPPTERLSRAVARQVCLRTNSKAYIAGSIAKAGDNYQLKLQAVNCQNEETIASVQAETQDRTQVLKVLNKADEQLRSQLGESLPSVRQFNKPLPEATTSSLEALQAYAAGRSVQTGSAEGIPYYKRAIELDPNFAMAYEAAGVAYTGSGQKDLAKDYYSRAYELRNRVTERERFDIENAYYWEVTGETAKAVKACEDGLKSYPDSVRLNRGLGISYLDAGEPEKAVPSLEKTRLLAPDTVAPYVNLMFVYIRLNRLDEAKLAFDEARKRNLDSDVLRRNRYLVAFLEEDEVAMRQEIDSSKGRPGYEDDLLGDAADTEAYHGHLAKAREFDRQAIASADRAGGKERASDENASAALREAEVGNSTLAHQKALQALAVGDDRVVRETAALALVESGDTAAAKKLADELAQKYPLNTKIQNYIVPTILALIELQQHRAANAIETLKPALSLELATVGFANMQPTYVRGLAFLQLGKGTEAAAEFQRMIDHSGIVGNSVTGALAYLQLARAEEMGGYSRAARTHYQDFFALWKDADPDVPILTQAKAEYTKLPK